MTFIPGKLCTIEVLHETEDEIKAWTDGVMGGVTMEYVFTGSLPLRYIDCKEDWRQEREAGSIQFGIWVDGRMVGKTGLHKRRDLYRSYEFRIIMFDAQDKGVGSEATWLVTDYAFRVLDVHRVWLGVNEENKRAAHVYEKIGFVKEGVLREDIWCYGKYVNAVRYGMLRPEWEMLCRLRGVETVGMLRSVPPPEGWEKHQV